MHVYYIPYLLIATFASFMALTLQIVVSIESHTWWLFSLRIW